MGVSLGDSDATIGANEENPKGFWERRDVIDLNEALLKESKATWHSPLHYSLDALTEKRRGELESRAKGIIAELPKDSSWVLKDPRLCLTAPLWCSLVEQPLIVFVHRDPIEVADSLQARNGFELSHGLALWEFYSRSALLCSKGASGGENIPLIKVSFNDLMQDPEQVTKQLFDSLCAQGVKNISLPEGKQTSAFIDQKLYRNRTKGSELSGILCTPQLELLQAIHAPDTLLPASENSRACTHALEHHQASVEKMNSLELLDARAITTPKSEILAELTALNLSYQNAKVQRAELELAYTQAKAKIAELEEAYEKSVQKREELESSYQKVKEKREEAEAAYSKCRERRKAAENAYQALKTKTVNS